MVVNAEDSNYLSLPRFCYHFEIIGECVVAYFGSEKQCEGHPLRLVNEVAKCRENHPGEVLS